MPFNQNVKTAEASTMIHASRPPSGIWDVASRGGIDSSLLARLIWTSSDPAGRIDGAVRLAFVAEAGCCSSIWDGEADILLLFKPNVEQ